MMGKITAIAWLLVCLLPAGGKAEDHVENSTWFSQSSSEDEKQPSLAPLLSEVTVRDEELSNAVGQGLETPWESYFFRKMETSDSRIKLWDEADRGTGNSGRLTGQDLYQRISLTTVVRK